MSVYPAVDDTIAVDIDEKDVRIDTYRSSGAGGQHVNTTDSAVRITHLPTGIVVQCQNERSQHKNRATAWAMLRARIYEAELKRREEAAQAAAAAKSDIGFGHQIRSYVLQPYQLVKDLRTGVESTNPSAVLDGDIDQFIEAALAERIHAEERARVAAGLSLTLCLFRGAGRRGVACSERGCRVVAAWSAVLVDRADRPCGATFPRNRRLARWRGSGDRCRLRHGTAPAASPANPGSSRARGPHHDILGEHAAGDL